MTFRYQLIEEDFLIHQLYIANQSPSIRNRRRNTRFIFSLIYLGFGAYFLFSLPESAFGFFSLFFSFLWFGFYPLYSRWFYRRHYQRHIREHYQNRTEKESELTLTKDFIYSKDDGSEGKISTEEVSQVVELPEHYFIRLKSNLSLIIPVHAIEDHESFKAFFDELGHPVVDHRNWKWT